MQKWEYLEVIRHESGEMADSAGRFWPSTWVKATTNGIIEGRRGEKAIEWEWVHGSGLADMGEEAWELVGVVPRTVRVARPGAGDIECTTLIFKRPKP